MLDDTRHPIDLSAEGRERRDAILRRARNASRSRARRRRTARATAVALPLVAVAAAIWLVPSSPTTVPVMPPAPNPTQMTEQPVATPTLRFTVALTSESTVERVTPAPTTTPARELSDDELLDLLREAGKPTGLIRTGDRAILSSDLERPPKPDRTKSERARNNA